MLTKEQSKKLFELIDEYAAVSIDHSWKGAQPPEGIRTLELELEVAKNNLKTFIQEL